MKPRLFGKLLLPSLMVGVVACSQPDVIKTDAAAGQGGMSGSGGVSGTGAGGAPSTGAGGATPGGSGGMPGGGAGGSSIGGAAGAGSAGASGSGGAMGAGGSGAGGAVTVTGIAGIPNQFGETLASSFFLVPCYQQAAQDCITIPTGTQCPNQNAASFEARGFTQNETFTLGGTPGTMYNLTFTVNGVAEAKYYTGGMRDAGNGVVANAQGPAGTDTFYRGGSPVAQEFYNVYKLVVRNPGGAELNHYYLNSFPQTTTPYEDHETFLLHYTKTIPVPGGGTVDLFMGDSNCHAVDNCGPGVYAGVCTASRSVPSEPTLKVPTTYMGKPVSSINLLNGANQPYHAQIIHITVNSVAAM
jgi:hypothetical protein